MDPSREARRHDFRIVGTTAIGNHRNWNRGSENRRGKPGDTRGYWGEAKRYRLYPQGIRAVSGGIWGFPVVSSTSSPSWKRAWLVTSQPIVTEHRESTTRESPEIKAIFSEQPAQQLEYGLKTFDNILFQENI